jgi:hypothetical protein
MQPPKSGYGGRMVIWLTVEEWLVLVAGHDANEQNPEAPST